MINNVLKRPQWSSFRFYVKLMNGWYFGEMEVHDLSPYRLNLSKFGKKRWSRVGKIVISCFFLRHLSPNFELSKQNFKSTKYDRIPNLIKIDPICCGVYSTAHKADDFPWTSKRIHSQKNTTSIFWPRQITTYKPMIL